MLSFFENHGTGYRIASNNSEALQQWLAYLKSSGSSDNAPVSWIQLMLQHEPTTRPPVNEIPDTILLYEDEHIYYGACCAPEEDTSSTYHGSVFAAGDLPASNQMDDSTQLFQTFNSAAKVRRTDSVSAKWLAIGSVDTNLLEIGNFQDPADAREQPAPQDVGQGPISQSHESIPPPQQHLSTLERLDPTVSHGQMVQNYLSAQIILQEIAVGNLLGPRRPLTDGLFKHRSKDRCGKLRIMAMDQDFDPHSFGRWFCQRVAWDRGTDGHPFKLAGRIWLALIFLELRLSVQAELLRISGTTRVEFDSDLTVPWAIIEHDSPYLFLPILPQVGPSMAECNAINLSI